MLQKGSTEGAKKIEFLPKFIAGISVNREGSIAKNELHDSNESKFSYGVENLLTWNHVAKL